MDSYCIESIKRHVLDLINEEIHQLDEQRLKFLSGSNPVKNINLSDVLDGIDETAYSLKCLADTIQELGGQKLNYNDLSFTIAYFNFNKAALSANPLASRFEKYLSILTYNFLVDIESLFADNLKRFEPDKLHLAIVVHSNTKDCIKFLRSELEGKKTNLAKRKFLLDLYRVLQGRVFFKESDYESWEYLEFLKTEPTPIENSNFQWVHFNFRTLEEWILDRLLILSPKLILKEDKSPGLKQRIAKFLTSREFRGEPIITVQQGQATDTIFNSSSFLNQPYSVNHPELLIAVIAWLHQQELIIGITEAKDWLAQFGFIEKGKYCCEKTCWNRLSPENPKWSRKVLGKWEVDLAAILAVENKPNAQKALLSASLSGFSKKFTVVDNKSARSAKFTQRMN